MFLKIFPLENISRLFDMIKQLCMENVFHFFILDSVIIFNAASSLRACSRSFAFI